MKLRAPPGAGNPSVGGVTITPTAGGVYELEHKVGAHLVEAFGFIDLDAAPQSAVDKARAQPDTVLRDAALAALKKFGVVMSGSPDDATLAKALAGAVDQQNDQTLAAVKRAETETENRVLAQFADEDTALKDRAEKAEALVSALQNELAAASKPVDPKAPPPGSA